MENTVSDAEKGRLPSANEEEFIESLYRGTFSVFLGQPKALGAVMYFQNIEWADGPIALENQPDVPRNLVIVLSGDGSDACTGTLIITGVDPDGDAVTEVLTPDGEGGGKELVGTKIFARIDSAVISDASGGSETTLVASANGDTIGLPFDIIAKAAVRHIYFNQTYINPADALDGIMVGPSQSGVDVHLFEAYDGVKTLIVFVQPTRRA